ncbi:MAG: CGxCxC motif mini-lipoprotein [Akkermansia sp.]|nr:CGxCxC motif mini-lipoprotein [Akkermansia sp.]
MKMIAICVLGVVCTVVLSACGNCNCNSYSSDALRDVPRSSSRSFY